MCDFSLQNGKSRPATVGDKLTTRDFFAGARGFAAPEDANTAVCVLPGKGTCICETVSCRPRDLLGWKVRTVNHTTAIFSKSISTTHTLITHHNALEFPDGQVALLTDRSKGRKRRCFSFRRNLLQRPNHSPGTGSAHLICGMEKFLRPPSRWRRPLF